MKKFFVILLALTMVLTLAGCSAKENGTTETQSSEAETSKEETSEEVETVVSEVVEESAEESVEETEETAEAALMTYADFVAADVDTAVVVEAYVQSAAYNAEYGNVTLFLADQDGAYYVYRAACDDALAEQLTVGAKICVEGFKGEWSGEVEIVDAVITVLDGADTYVAEAVDVTDILGAEELAEKMNSYVAVTGAVVVGYNEAEDPFSYSWDGSGAAGSNSDLYFNVEVGGAVYCFTVESDENPEGSDVYTAVTELQVGDTIDLEGFLYWYEGAQLHVSKVTK